MNHISDIDIDTIANLDDQSSSTTAAACEAMQRYGAAPGENELDTRDVWDADPAIDALGEAIQLIAANITPDGTQLADEREALPLTFASAQGLTVDHAFLQGSISQSAPSVLAVIQAVAAPSQVCNRALAVISRKNRSTRLSQDEEVGMKCTLKCG